MGGGSSRSSRPSVYQRMQLLRELDTENNDIRVRINTMRSNKQVIEGKINDITTKIENLQHEISSMKKDITTNSVTKQNLEDNIKQLKKDKHDAEYLLNATNQAITEQKQFYNVQKRTQPFLDNENNQLYNKVIKRQSLKYDDYIKRNALLTRTKEQLEQKYSNDNRNSEYQDQHNKYFMTLNSIFWWIYYLLFTILYRFIYVKEEMNLKTKSY